MTYGQELKPGVTYVATTNHYDEDFSDEPDYYYESSWKRLERLMEILPEYETYDLNTCWNILTDHGDGEPNDNTISRNGTYAGTILTNIFSADEVYYTLGMPDRYLEVYKTPQYASLREMERILTSFSAIPGSEKVILKWSTASETNTKGFNLYRAELEEGPYTQINPSLITPKGSPEEGAFYTFVDRNARNRKTYYYKLEEAYLTDGSMMHGPVRATLKSN